MTNETPFLSDGNKCTQVYTDTQRHTYGANVHINIKCKMPKGLCRQKLCEC